MEIKVQIKLGDQVQNGLLESIPHMGRAEEDYWQLTIDGKFILDLYRASDMKWRLQHCNMPELQNNAEQIGKIIDQYLTKMKFS